MIGGPWYLLAAGIGLVILGHFVESFSSPKSSRDKPINPKMRDKDIIESLNRQERLSIGSLIFLLGLILAGLSVLWRLARYFV